MSAMRPDLYEAVKQAISDASPQPANEADTCNRIIYPLLLAAGYSRKEIKSQDRDAAKQKPDYTLLPESPDHTWFLEAKAWGVGLDDSHAAQAVNYANTQGKRWVVLTNGKDWRLYDNDIREVAEKKLAVGVGLKDESFVSFLEAISRQSITEGKLEDFVLNQRLYSALAVQLAKPDSDAIKAIRKVLRGLPGLGQVSGAKIVGFFQSERAAGPVAAVQQDDISSSPAKMRDEPLVVREGGLLPSPAQSIAMDGMCLLTPVKADYGKSAEEIIRSLLDQGWYVFGDRSAGRKRLGPGDMICFYEGKKGVVAEARVATVPEEGIMPGLSNPQIYKWRFRVTDVRYFFDAPIAIDVPTRCKLEAFRDKDPSSSRWSWFVQGTGIISVHDFEILTGRKT